MCRLLIDAGADVTAKNLDGATALHYLARISNPENPKLYMELLKLVLRKGAAVNEVNRHNETPLHQAAMKGATLAVEFLVTNKGDPNRQNEFGETALHYAVRLGAVKCIELLLAAGADVFLEGEREEGSALSLAEVTGQAEILGMMKRSSSYLDHVKKYGDRSLKNTLRGAGTASTRAAAEQQAAVTAAAPPAPVPATTAPAGAGRVVSGARASGVAGTVGNVAFGVARGACRQPGCECAGYRWDSGAGDGGPCLNCGDFPTQHRRLEPGEEGAGAGAGGGGGAAVAPDEARAAEALGEAVKDLSHSWYLDKEEVKKGELLGEGTAARVYKGKYRGQDVAIKILKESLDKNQLTDFAKEFQIYSDLRSPHVVLFFGICIDTELRLVFEFCSRGSLFDVLNSDEELDWSRVLKLSQVEKPRHFVFGCSHFFLPGRCQGRQHAALVGAVDCAPGPEEPESAGGLELDVQGVGPGPVALHVGGGLQPEHAGQAAGHLRLLGPRGVLWGPLYHQARSSRLLCSFSTNISDQGRLLLGRHHFLGARLPLAHGRVRHALLRVRGARL